MSHRLCPGRTSRQISRAVRAAILFSSVASIGLASAQEESGNAQLIDEVVVTAQFREQSVQETPLSITAVSGAMLESRNLAEITNQAPSVSLKPQGASYGPSLGASIRGIGQFDFNPALEPGVGIYVDDVYFATLTGSILDLLDLDRIEILRGPQGTLAGRNSIGGAVKLYSRKPTGEGGYVSGTFGSRERVDFRGSADFEITENLYARLSGVSKEQNGYVQIRDYGCDHPGSGLPVLANPNKDCVLGYGGEVNYTAMRGQLRWIASDSVEVGFAVDYTRDDRNAAGAVLVEATSAVNPNTQPIQGVTSFSPADFVPPKGSYYNYASYYNPAGTFTYLSGGSAGTTVAVPEMRADGRVDYEGWGTSANVDWTISDRLSLKSITAYREYNSYFSNDNDWSPLSSSLGYGHLSFHSVSQELRLNGAFLDDDRLEYTLGAFYMDQRSIYQTTQDLRYSATTLTQFRGNDPVNADTTALFAHVSFAATDKLTLIGGLRYTDEHKDYTFRRRTFDGQMHPSLGLIDGVKTNYDGDKFDYRANITYQWTDDVMTYVQYATGFKGGGVSPRPFNAAQAVPFDPEELESYEVGIKSDLFDRMLRLNASVFFSEYTDMHLSLSNCPQYGVGLPCAVIANAGDAEIKGVEVEAILRPIDGLTIDASYSYLDFKYTYINPDAGGPTRPTGPQYGMRPAYMPETKWSAGIQYEFVLGSLGTLTPRVDVSYQGDVYTNGTNRPTNLIESYTLTNARLTWRTADELWETSLEVTNVTDEYYFLTRFDQYTITGISDGQPGRPREWALTVKRKF
jgi:iron complex outermembrane receptor protein